MGYDLNVFKVKCINNDLCAAQYYMWIVRSFAIPTAIDANSCGGLAMTVHVAKLFRTIQYYGRINIKLVFAFYLH